MDETAEQAALEGVPLADVEKKMMYFTESDAASCPDPLELNEEFEAQCETRAYETKISRLLRHAYQRLKEENPERARNWDQAIRTLHKGDHYLLVMVNQSNQSEVGWGMPILWGIGIAVLIFVVIVVKAELDQKGLIPSWVFGWVSTNTLDQKMEFSLVLCGCFGLWLIVKLAKSGDLGDTTKTLFRGIVSTFSFLRPKGPSRK